ncbi:hypothetical protein KUCAC02_002692, partial [Chaenocephalus aceratus]
TAAGEKLQAELTSPKRAGQLVGRSPELPPSSEEWNSQPDNSTARDTHLPLMRARSEATLVKKQDEVSLPTQDG